MRHFVLLSTLLFSTIALGQPKVKTFMPPNQLYLQDSFEAVGGLSQAQFNAVIDRVAKVYKPIFAKFGANLVVEKAWDDPEVNAYAEQTSPTTWVVHMYGGLARRPEVTEDGFALVLTHEIGHHLGGYPFYAGDDWAADEGQADTHASGAGAFKVFPPSAKLAAKAKEAIPANMKAKCDAAHATAANRSICYRSVVASKSLADLLGALDGQKVSYDTPDKHVVTTTDDSHPAAQCRLDTMVAAALCGNYKWDYTLIPGKKLYPKNNSKAAQDIAYAHGCSAGVGARPRCWFAPVK